MEESDLIPSMWMSPSMYCLFLLPLMQLLQMSFLLFFFTMTNLVKTGAGTFLLMTMLLLSTMTKVLYEIYVRPFLEASPVIDYNSLAYPKAYMLLSNAMITCPMLNHLLMNQKRELLYHLKACLMFLVSLLNLCRPKLVIPKPTKTKKTVKNSRIKCLAVLSAISLMHQIPILQGKQPIN